MRIWRPEGDGPGGADQRSHRLDQTFRARGNEQQGGAGASTGQPVGGVKRLRAVEAQGFGVEQLTVVADAPVIVQADRVEAFSHRGAPEDQRLDDQGLGIADQINRQGAVEVRAIEQDGFLRQPAESTHRPRR